MGLFSILYYVIVSTTMLFLILNYAPNLLEFEPQVYTPQYLKYEGALSVNKELNKAQIVMRGEAVGAESMVSGDGGFYASLHDGRIVFIRNDKVVKTVADTCKNFQGTCRPLGLRLYKGDLYVATPGRGLVKVIISTGEVKVVLSSVGGKKLKVLFDLDIDEEGQAYLTEATTRWEFPQFIFSVLEHENSGRVIKYNIETGKTDVIISNLYNPNGIQLSADKNSLLISEVTNNRILRYHLQGTKKGQVEVFANLPGEPELIRPSSGGGYWVPLFSSREASSPQLMDRLATYPKVKKALVRLSHILSVALDKIIQYWQSPVLESISNELKTGQHFMMLWSVDKSVLVELDDQGKIIRSLHSNNPQLSYFSQTLEHEGYLYLGSYMNQFLSKLKL